MRPIPTALPAAGYTFARVTEGESGATVHRLTRTRRRTLYLKSGTHAVAADITGEMDRLAWFAGRMPVPKIVAFHRTSSAWHRPILSGDLAAL